LDETEIGMAGQSTVFGDAIGLAIKLFDESGSDMFDESGSDNRVLIVLTDGNDTGSVVPPVDAAKVAQTRDIRIYTIAVGDPASAGEEALDIETLERVAEITGGRTFQALDQDALNTAYQTIAELEPELYETISFRPRSSLHWLPIAGAFTVYLLFHSWFAWLTHRKLGDTHV
jgi:Ca-activated chloride channel family protein